MYYPAPKYFINDKDWRAWKKLANTSSSRAQTLNKIKNMQQKFYSNRKRCISETPISSLQINLVPKHKVFHTNEFTKHTKLAPIPLAPAKSVEKTKCIKVPTQIIEFSYPMIFKSKHPIEKNSESKILASLDFTSDDKLFEFHKKNHKTSPSPKTIEHFQIKDIILVGKQSALTHKNSDLQEDRHIETPTPWQDGENHKRRNRGNFHRDSQSFSLSIAVSTDIQNI
ncbi:hypothetical protein SteCoe_25765 [Stentor coeruleus]|uniref:Uncharacterized protein n=1 Tax=Stentor coeruleus TaxID=5963 RepID=A0A1R2BEG9_9CILI|nr:hypothetical protein SteCoe_25765 [Stentor coeruleus]